MKKLPKVSIITVTRNAEGSIEDTINSVVDQNYKDIEYILIDGNSFDDTVQIIKRYEKFMAYWVSEPDLGIYDAMNKGAKESTGNILYYLNSGDILYDTNVIRDMVDIYIQTNACLIYGNIEIFSPNENVSMVLKRKLTLNGVRKGRKISHQAFFINRSCVEELPLLNIDYHIASDFDLECRYVKGNKSVKYIDRTICTYKTGGVSSNLKESYRETARIIYKYFGPCAFYKYRIKKYIILLSAFIIEKLRLTKFYLKLRSLHQ
jgi:glycosyltransferase involved in cell wall biosynthesis